MDGVSFVHRRQPKKTNIYLLQWKLTPPFLKPWVGRGDHTYLFRFLTQFLLEAILQRSYWVSTEVTCLGLRFLNTFFIFRPTWENDPKNRTKWVETTHYSCPGYHLFCWVSRSMLTKALLGNSAEVCRMSLGKPDRLQPKTHDGPWWFWKVLKEMKHQIKCHDGSGWWSWILFEWIYIYFKKQNIFYSLDMLISSNKKYGSVCWKMGPELRLMLLFAGK